MPLDKIVDSATLDGAMTATADAIRAKTGAPAPIVWDVTSGFAQAIAGITTGGGGDTTIEDGLITRTLTEYSNDRVTNIGSYAFSSNTIIEKVSFPNVTLLNASNVFQGCTSLKSINFPKLEWASGGGMFRNCTALTEIVLPSINTLPSFQGCTNLKKLDLSDEGKQYVTYPPITIGANALAGAAVDTLILRIKMGIFSLGNVNAFDKTPFAIGGTGGTVYVPQALIAEYQQATNWSTLYAAGTCTFLPIEGSEYE